MSARRRVPAQLPSLYAIPMIALSIFVMAYSGLMGPLGIFIFYGLWFPLLIRKGRGVVFPEKGSGFAFAYLALCCASTLWSDYTSVTFRAAFELGTMIVCSLIIANTVPSAAYVRGLILGIDIVLAASLFSGNYGVDPFGGPATLVGLFGSKNQLGFFAELAIYMSIIFCLAKVHWIARLKYALPTFLIGSVCLIRCHSASAVASLAITLAVLGTTYALAPLSRRLRASVMIAVATLFPLVAIIGVSLGLQNLVLAGFGKDATLTGRTYLWGQGLDFGMHQPVLGVGYTAFWVQGRPMAERLWYEFFIGARSGFHFHDTYVEVFVELGIAGFLILASWLATTLFTTLRAIAARGPSLALTLPLGVSVMLLIRSFVEVDILGPFGIGIFLFLPILPNIAVYMRSLDNSPPSTPVQNQ